LPAGSALSNFLNVELTVNETGTFKMQNESSIAVNPANPDNLIGSAVDYRDTSATWVYVSHDGAKTWTNLKLGRPHSGWSASNDPSVAYDLDGTGYLVIGAFGKRSSGLQGQAVENGVYLLRTTDEGRTWTSHIPVIEHTGEQTIDSTFEDKYYIWCDNSGTSPYKEHLYIPWKRVWAKDSATQIVISKSTDKGNTWSQPVAVSPRLPGTSEDTTYGQSFPYSVTGPNGEIYLVWNNGIEHAVGFARSLDGGIIWTEPRLIQHYNIFGKTKEIEPGIWRHVVKDRVRAEAYPSLAVDNTGGPHKGWLYLTWAADRVPNIYFSRSTDMGETWSEPVIVHSDTTNDQLWQWIALDRTTGDIAVMYLDSRDDPNNIEVAAYVSYSSDGGTTWTDRRAADVTSDLRKNPFRGNVFAGDYNGCAFHKGIIYPSWVDMRNAVKNIYDSDVYSAIININKPGIVENFEAITIPEEPESILLQWDKVAERAFGQPLAENDVKYLLKREGQTIATLDGDISEYTDTGLEKFKLYRYSISAVAGGDTSASIQDSAWAGGSREPGIPLLAGHTRDLEEVVVYYQIPVKRLDGVTPFVNPAYINEFKDYKPWRAKPITVADTGKIKSFNDLVKKDGFYSYNAYVIDTFKNFGPMSDTLILYAGSKHNTYNDDFNEAQMRKYSNQNTWGLSQDFSVSGNSLTDSPEGDYKPRTNNMLTIFPYEGDAKQLQLRFTHAVCVEKRDSAIVEYSCGSSAKWKLLAFFDKTMYPAWEDGIKDNNDWKREVFTITADSVPLYIRFRLKTNTIKQNDGWYIDNLSYSDVLSVDENSGLVTLYPNPVQDYFYIDFTSLETLRINSIEIIDLLGNKIVSARDYDKKTIMFDTSQLSAGAYNVIIRLSNGDYIVKKFVKIWY
jgi:hypothetical protein